MLLVSALLVGFGAQAAPVVTIRGKTTLKVEEIFATVEGGVRVIGRLEDLDLHTGIPRQTVRIETTVDGSRLRLSAKTDEQGRFSVELPPTQQRRFQISAEFFGAQAYAAARPPAQDLDITKKTPSIQLSTRRELELPARHLSLEITTTVEGQPVSLPVALKGGAGASLGQVHTDGRGQARVELPVATLGGPGVVSIEARFSGDGGLNPASALTDTLIVSSVQLELSSAQATVRADDDLALAGRIMGDQGGIQGATIDLEVMGRHQDTTLSDAAGRFTFALSARDYPPGELDLITRFSPDVIWRRPASSNALKIKILPPTPIPVRLYVVPAVITALIMLGLLVVRFGPSLRSRLGAHDEEPVVGLQGTEEPVASGARFSRTGLRGLIKQASDMHGVIWDPVDQRPIPGARLRIEGPQGSVLELTSDGRGRFAVPGLAPGSHTVTVGLRGFVSERFGAQIPHRGGLHGVRIDLVQVRVRVLEIYRAVALPLLPERELWACWTPRQLCRHIGSAAGQRQWHLEQLTDLLEEAYWSGSPPDEELLGRARQLQVAL